MEPKINTFIFDCFGVVCSTPLFSWYEENMTNRGFTDNKFLDVCKELDLGNLSEEDIAEYLSRYKEITLNKEKIQDQIDGYLKINADIIDIINKLKNKKYKIVLLSNANNSYFERKIYTTYPEFKNLFDDIIISSNIKMLKPDPKIYIYTLQKINSKPEESLFIDDSQTNVDGALKIGMQGFLYTDSVSFAEYIKNLGIKLNE